MLKNIKENFILILDVLSRYCYAKPLPQEINPNTLKKVFNELFDEGMPKFNILKSPCYPLQSAYGLTPV